MKVKYADRQIGQFYYCLSQVNTEYIFQYQNNNVPHTINNGSKWCTVNCNADFDYDWSVGVDRILRLATPEEIEIFKSMELRKKIQNYGEYY